MNAPDRQEKFVVPEGIKKVAFKPDTKVANAGSFTSQREDHTVGNLIRMQLHRDRNVVFAGYRIPHPLEYQMVVKVQTNGKKTPIQAVQHSLQDLGDEVNDIRAKFQEQLSQFGGGPGGGMGGPPLPPY
ncbi:DNA-directed RNA polymerases IV and V subunit 11 [Micractinium conductrix]|uniref:DNA-directed RNA polymerases IV and V subunit 11 n=1 Tax=Micractinium conductrix TaxID=554055 RepID=A0A2P6VJN7_9CHLO|nr:DNA-directed RNA polymerases IV and V subunit 11 [Micractinium conductrix]|eukprot:PSC74288.1 DNA-directed RNA polymerases IV and V subunit 11 [Micractinium conductrix]